MALHFGVHTGLQNTTTDQLRGLWRDLEAAGYEWLSIWDHFYAADLVGHHGLEAVSMHAALALSTERVRCGSLVYSIGYRHPAVLANAAATLDQLSGGRVTMGLGAGWHRPEYEAHGLDFPAPGVRLRQLDEGIQCIRGLLTEDEFSFDGDHFTMRGARCEPHPVQKRLPLWIGGAGEQVTLRIAARHADGWNVPFISPEEFAHKGEVLDRHCQDVGRDPGSITRSANVGLAWREEDLDAQFGPALPLFRPGILTGSVGEVTDRVAAYAEAGAEWVILAARAPFDVEGLHRFAEEIAPSLR